MIRIAGRKESPGRPFLYETTREFLVAFGLRDLGDLPKVEGELIVPELAGRAAQLASPGPSRGDDRCHRFASARSWPRRDELAPRR